MGGLIIPEKNWIGLIIKRQLTGEYFTPTKCLRTRCCTDSNTSMCAVTVPSNRMLK